MINQPVQAANCSDNDVVKCGYTTPSNLAGKITPEISALYNHAFVAGWGMGDVNNWKANAKHATVYRDGRVILDDGTIVATGAYSLGRLPIEGNVTKVNIGGHDWWYGPTTGNFASNSLPAYVLINPDNHSLQFAALTACGNPVWGKTPSYKCTMLNKQKVNDTTYNFTTKVDYNNTSLTKLVYDFGDGKTQTVTSNFGQTVNHVYAPGKSYTAKVTAYFKANGQEKSDTRKDCTATIDVPQPPKPVFACDGLTGTLIEGSRTKFKFTVTGHSDKTTLRAAQFNFDDGKTQIVGATSGKDSISTDHEYADVKTYKVTARLAFDAGNTDITEKCTTSVTVYPPTCKDTPTKPECQPPVKTCADTPDAPECKDLPDTGPAEIVGSALGLSSVAGAGMYYRNTRRNWINKTLNKR